MKDTKNVETYTRLLKSIKTVRLKKVVETVYDIR